MDNGWVKLHRQMFSNKLWLSEPFTKAQAWIDLFANANHEDGSFWIRGNEVKILRGQIGWSELTMVKRWHWSKNKVRRFLKWLETEQQIVQQKYRYMTTIITINNYDKYQQTEQQTIQQKDSRKYINKNVKKKENDKNIEGEQSSQEVPEVIKLFEVINPACKRYYGNTTQREAVISLVTTYGLERVKLVIEKTLPKTNKLDYFPKIVTPLQLWEKWSSLEATIISKRAESSKKDWRNNVIL